MKKKMSLLKRMITDHLGGISSKIIIGSVAYMVLLLTMIIVAFVNPNFPNIDGIFITLITVAAALLGLTTVENTTTILKGKTSENTEDE